VAPRLLATGIPTLTIGLVNAQETARRWADVWSSSWPAKDAESIVNLYAEGARYSAYPFREPDEGPQGVRSYLTRIFGEEEDIECWFGEPGAGDDSLQSSDGRVGSRTTRRSPAPVPLSCASTKTD